MSPIKKIQYSSGIFNTKLSIQQIYNFVFAVRIIEFCKKKKKKVINHYFT